VGPRCAASERPVYACPFGKSAVSVCATDRTVTYRHAANGKTDLTITSTGKDGRAHLSTIVGGGGGHQTSLRFSSAGHDYIVYSAVYGALTEAAGRRASGLVVMRGPDRQISSRQCPVGGKAQRLDRDSAPSFVADEDVPDYEAWF
ncbi:MAG TPA: hypothetical protein VN113_06220, partial [Caulobacter sp.]|nr:hypothetical protein [Caulobacter sp.]